MARDDQRTELIVQVLDDAFAPLMEADPVAFRRRYRRMASDPHAFYRGSACLFYADVTGADDPFADERSGQIWIQGDLHVENFGTYLNAAGRLVFDVNDFDEAYLGHFTWDLMRFAASLSLVGWQKALPEEEIRGLLARYLRAYLEQVDHYRHVEDDTDFALRLDNTSGPVLAALQQARGVRRVDLLDARTQIQDHARVFSPRPGVRRLNDAERDRVVEAFERYLGTIPPAKRVDRDIFYEIRDVVGSSGFGIGSAGLSAYTVLVEGFDQALENDVLLSVKQANVPALSRFVDSSRLEEYFEHEAHRTVVSRRALQAHTDPLLGYTTIEEVGFVVAEVSPYEIDLDWAGLTEPEDIAQVVGLLGQATAKIHCASDEDSEQDLVDQQVEQAIADSVEGRSEEFVDRVCDFGVEYAERARADYDLFVDAFRSGRIAVAAT